MRHINIFLATLILSLVTFNASTAKRTKEGRTIVVLHTNDAHSQIFPFNKNLMDTLKAGRAGFVRRVNFVNQQRAQTPSLLLLDSGDFSQGSSYYTMFRGDVEIGLMNIMHYDAATIGNHEFDFGLENMARLFKMAEFPIVCANYDFTGTPCEGIVKPYTVIVREGVRIGIFGLSPKLEGLVTTANYGATKYLDPIESAKKTVNTLRKKEKCDIVICLSHLGWLFDEMGDPMLIEQTSGIDIVLGGHTHTYLNPVKKHNNADGHLVHVDQNGKSSIYVSRLDIKVK